MTEKERTLVAGCVKGEKAAYSENWETWWNFDWRLLTDRLLPFKDQINFVTRGRGHAGFALQIPQGLHG